MFGVIDDDSCVVAGILNVNAARPVLLLSLARLVDDVILVEQLLHLDRRLQAWIMLQAVLRLEYVVLLLAVVLQHSVDAFNRRL